jgi:YggT family protein
MIGLLLRTIYSVLNIIVYLILGRAIMSWFIRPGDRLFPLYMGIIRLTEPILSPFRNITARFMGNSGIDFSPMLAIFAIYFFQMLVGRFFLLASNIIR